MLSRLEILQNILGQESIYHPEMEVQVLASDKANLPISDIEPHSFRISSEEEGNKSLGYPSEAIDKIGLSGWNFKEKKSEWVGFDFDSQTGHKRGLSESEINLLIDKGKEIPWLEIRRSTSGLGIHIYVFLQESPPIESRKEHKTLAISILDQLSCILSFDFRSKVDTAGGILWIWSKKRNINSFSLIKPAEEKLRKIPENWRETKELKRQKVASLISDIKYHSLDSEHDKLLKWFAKKQCTWWWNSDLNMLTCHTFNLSEAHKELGLRGLFYTISTGKDCPNDQNCFAFPLKNGSWIVRRHSPGTKEHSYWRKDKSGWTYCYYNRIPTVDNASNLFGGKQNTKGDWIFRTPEQIIETVRAMSGIQDFEIPVWARGREFCLRKIKGNKIGIFFDAYPNDEECDWLKYKNKWEKTIELIYEEKETKIPDNIIRHVVSSGEDGGWFIRSNEDWHREPKANVVDALHSLGYQINETKEMMGQSVLNPWKLVNYPFQSEYPGGREWNKFSVQLMFVPKEGDWNLWKSFLQHLGNSINESVQRNEWCKEAGIKTGGDYLFYWLCSVFQYPSHPLPYLFFFGGQNTGKSSFHEAIGLLIKGGLARAESALTNPQRFNKELAGAIICITEEFNLATNKEAYERIKDWVTSKTISIHEKRMTPLILANTTHWIQCANNPSFCPISIGDSRILVIEVEQPKEPIPKDVLFEKLSLEGSAFTYALLNQEIPQAVDRLRIPLIETQAKEDEQLANANPVEEFILTKCFLVKGEIVLFSDFVLRFKNWMDLNNGKGYEWSSKKISSSISISDKMPVKGRYGSSGDIYLGNLSFEDKPNCNFYYAKGGDRLVKVEEIKNEKNLVP